MQVINNKQKIFVTWRYDNPELDLILHFAGISQKTAKDIVFGKGGQEALLDRINETIYLASIPKPQITHCILLDENKKKLKTASVRRHPEDIYSKEKARTYSLTRVLRETYPGRENKEVRKLFWDVYLSRIPKKEPKEITTEKT